MKKVLELIQSAIKELGTPNSDRGVAALQQLKAAESNIDAEVKHSAPPAEPAKQPDPTKKKEGGFTRLGLMIVMGIMALVTAVLCATARAGESLNATNQLAQSVAYVSYPTNSVGTNGYALTTGGTVEVRNYNRIGVSVTIQANAANTGNTLVQLIRSNKSSKPSSGADFESSPPPQLLFTIANNGTTLVKWYTNIDETILGPATSYIGAYYATNTGAGLITNFVVEIEKKIIPIRYP